MGDWIGVHGGRAVVDGSSTRRELPESKLGGEWTLGRGQTGNRRRAGETQACRELGYSDRDEAGGCRRL